MLCVSLHRQYDAAKWRYPGPNSTNPHIGAVGEVGGGGGAEGGAEGRNVNVAWPEPKLHDADYVTVAPELDRSRLADRIDWARLSRVGPIGPDQQKLDRVLGQLCVALTRSHSITPGHRSPLLRRWCCRWRARTRRRC